MTPLDLLGIVLSLAIGVSLGLLGGGGSILTLPILVYVFRLETKTAIATSLLVVGITSAAALFPHARAGRVHFRVGAIFGLASMAGAYGGGRIAHFVPSAVLLVSFATMMLVTGLAMLRGRAARDVTAGPRPWGRILAIGAGIGLLTGVIGAGGGFVIVPALALLCGLSIPSAIATSLFVITMNSFAGFAGYLGHVVIDPHVAVLVSGAAVVGSVIGAALAGRIAPDTLRRVFAWLVLAMSIFMITRQASWAWGGAAFVVAAAGALVLRRPPRASPT